MSLEWSPLIDFSKLQQYNPGKASVVLDCNKQPWLSFALDKRNPVNLEHISPTVINAFLAAEDWQFFKHHGLSLRGILRSTLVNIRHGRVVQGASTITQQLVKLLFFDGQRTFSRKLKEQLYALLVEKQCTKEHILETYLNHVYFGGGVYGIEAASQRFWNRSVQELTVAQAALLASIVCAPNYYSPYIRPLSVLQKRNSTLKKMLHLGFITQNEYVHAHQEAINLCAPVQEEYGLYAKESIRIFLEEQFGKNTLYTEGLTILSTIDTSIQKKSDVLFKKQFKKIKQLHGADVQGALITLDVKTCAIRALVGGYDFYESSFNRALQAKKQQGSVFKPLVYTSALLHGRSLIDMALDEPLALKQPNGIWRPRNHTRRFDGPMTLARALSFSNNIISIKTILDIGCPAVVNLAKKFHLSEPIPCYPSLALGCVDSTLSEVASMFNVFASDGIYHKPYLIEWVKDCNGKKLYKHHQTSECLIPTPIAQQVRQVLSIGLERQKKRSTEWIDSEGICKTGTTNDSRVCWFVGSTPELTTALYMGADNNRPLGLRVFPLQTIYPLWFALHKEIPTRKKQFAIDPHLEKIKINWKTGCLSDQEDSEVVTLLL